MAKHSGSFFIKSKQEDIVLLHFQLWVCRLITSAWRTLPLNLLILRWFPYNNFQLRIELLDGCVDSASDDGLDWCLWCWGSLYIYTNMWRLPNIPNRPSQHILRQAIFNPIGDGSKSEEIVEIDPDLTSSIPLESNVPTDSTGWFESNEFVLPLKEASGSHVISVHVTNQDQVSIRPLRKSSRSSPSRNGHHEEVVCHGPSIDKVRGASSKLIRINNY